MTQQLYLCDTTISYTTIVSYREASNEWIKTNQINRLWLIPQRDNIVDNDELLENRLGDNIIQSLGHD